MWLIKWTNWLIGWLTNCIEQSPSEEANCFHLIKCLAMYRNHRAYKSQSLVPILNRINAVHCLLSWCFKVHSVFGNGTALFVAVYGMVCRRLLAGIAGSNPAGSMVVFFCVYCLCCRVKVSATGRSFFQRSPSGCAVSECDLETSTMRRQTRAVEPWRKYGALFCKWRCSITTCKPKSY